MGRKQTQYQLKEVKGQTMEKTSNNINSQSGASFSNHLTTPTSYPNSKGFLQTLSEEMSKYKMRVSEIQHNHEGN